MDMEKKFLILKLNDQNFAVELRFAREIIPYTKPTGLPQAPYFLEGLIHLRRFFLPLIDTKSLLGLPNSNDIKKKKIVIVSIQKKIIGLKVDDVEDIIRVDEKQILPTPSLVSNLQHNYFSCGFYLNNNVTMILDLEKLFLEHLVSIKKAIEGGTV